jgi:hypothetical protein
MFVICMYRDAVEAWHLVKIVIAERYDKSR